MPLNSLIRGPPEVVASSSLPARRVSTTPALATQSLEQTMESLISENQALKEKNAALEQKVSDVNDRLDRMEETLVGGPKSKPKKPLGRDSRMSWTKLVHKNENQYCISAICL
ncbi:hypothetical protein RO3G_07709 [Rhizopus delemar RA 99-880]|uniref:Uncharacterized protein n=1 Tax=Rhizopus delemar (strain RA 99-880 / ATCC MYA-4621 / FGSC 9543 / NRRL 43880) TaxID=246409 RepID=I1C3H4_RHIO9|nr:hypothetical protein RO3G_07709 [Rhizopus delemar RA 99-880]|eukprot:EIE83004.1 hypothetical protein RO3G_07709 [Rhizopus delemar RA 99-880]